MHICLCGCFCEQVPTFQQIFKKGFVIHKITVTYFTLKSWLCFLSGSCCYCPRAPGTIQMNHSSGKRQILPRRGDTVLQENSTYLQQSKREYSKSLPPKELPVRKILPV